MDKNFRKIARPPHIINEQNQYLLFYFMMKISPYFTYFFHRYTNIKPNTLTFLSIFFLLVSFPLIIYKYYFLAFLLLFFNLLLDNIDGELARVNNQSSKLGEFLERINSDIFYVFFYNFICLSFYIENVLELHYVILFIIISLAYFYIRQKISHINIPDKFNINSSNEIFLGLFKYSNDIRNNNFKSKIIYLFFWNIIASGGVSEIILAILILSKNYELTISYIFFYNIIVFIYMVTLLFIKIFLRFTYKS
tara:strand:+ start:264 stop:1016 length:753 start_codon:yes stop_codon:yes gene_type:complete